MRYTQSSVCGFAIRPLAGCTPGGWNKSFGCLARPVNTYVEKLGLAKMACLLLVFCAVTAIVSPAQSLNPMLDFNGTNGAILTWGLVQGTDGNFYGTTFAWRAQRVFRGLWHGLQNHPWGHADHAVQLLLPNELH